MPFCPNCGKEVSDGVTFCPHCGQRLKEGFTPEERQKYIKELKASIKGEQPEKKTKMTKKLLIGLASVIGIFILIGIIAIVTTPEEQSTQPEKQPTQIQPETTPTESTPTETTPYWAEVISWEGNSIKDTETFSITANEWRIRWSTEPGQYGDMNFQIYVYKASGSLKSIAANVIGEGSDVSYVRGSGDYYLTINTAQPYTVTIEQKQ